MWRCLYPSLRVAALSLGCLGGPGNEEDIEDRWEKKRRGGTYTGEAGSRSSGDRASTQQRHERGRRATQTHERATRCPCRRGGAKKEIARLDTQLAAQTRVLFGVRGSAGSQEARPEGKVAWPSQQPTDLSIERERERRIALARDVQRSQRRVQLGQRRELGLAELLVHAALSHSIVELADEHMVGLRRAAPCSQCATIISIGIIGIGIALLLLQQLRSLRRRRRCILLTFCSCS